MQKLRCVGTIRYVTLDGKAGKYREIDDEIILPDDLFARFKEQVRYFYFVESVKIKFVTDFKGRK